jgi:hypothetical protein
MITIPDLVAQALGSFLNVEMRGRFGASHAALAELMPYRAKLTLECIRQQRCALSNTRCW